MKNTKKRIPAMFMVAGLVGATGCAHIKADARCTDGVTIQVR